MDLLTKIKNSSIKNICRECGDNEEYVRLSVIEKLFEAQTAKGGQAEVLVVPKIADVEENITYIKQSQKRIVIEGNEGYSDGYWTIIIYDPFGDEEFKYTITDKESDSDYSFADFLIEAMIKYKESNFTA